MNFTLYRSDFAGVEANCRYLRQQKEMENVRK